MQPGLSHFGDERGFLAYARRWGTTLVLGDPVAPRSRQAELIREFLACQRAVVFCQISESVAELLVEHGYYLNEMGVDTHLDLPSYALSGREREWLRYAANWTHRRGLEVCELPSEPAVLAEVAEVSREWRESRTISNREVRFLNRPLVLEAEQDTRRFFLRDPAGKIQAFVFFDPLYRAGRVIGYCTCFKRRRPEATSYAEAAIMHQAIRQFRSEDRETLSLGLSPMAWITNTRFRRNPFLHFSFRYAFRAWWVNRYFYSLVGHAEHKRKFRGIERPTYYASQVLLNDLRVAAMLRECQVI